MSKSKSDGKKGDADDGKAKAPKKKVEAPAAPEMTHADHVKDMVDAWNSAAQDGLFL